VGYLRDTADHAVLSAIKAYDPADTARDPVRAVYWAAGAGSDDLVEFDGTSRSHARSRPGAFKFNSLLEWLLDLVKGGTGGEHTGKRTVIGAASSGSGSKPRDAPPRAEASTASGETDAERRARLRAKMEEADRRDQARREKLAKKQAEQRVAAAEGEGEGEGATPVEDAPAPAPEAEGQVREDVQVDGAAEPEPEAAAEEAQRAGEAKETRSHEEL
jgi:protein disulfide-isomerase A6